MNYMEFTLKVKEKIQNQLDNTVRIEMREVTNSWNESQVGICVGKAGEKMCAVFYLLDLFILYRLGVQLDDCVDYLVEVCKCGEKTADEMTEIIQGILCWETAQKKVYPVLQKRSASKRFNDRIQHPFLDMDMSYIIWLDTGKDYAFSMKVTPVFLAVWEITEETLKNQAVENVGTEGLQINTLLEYSEGCPMIGVTNPFCKYGAAEMLNPRLFSEISWKCGKNLYILPSSIHDIILILDSGDIKTEDLNKIIRQVNQEMVEEKEQLSDHAYYFDRNTGEVTIAC